MSPTITVADFVTHDLLSRLSIRREYAVGRQNNMAPGAIGDGAPQPLLFSAAQLVHVRRSRRRLDREPPLVGAVVLGRRHLLRKSRGSRQCQDDGGSDHAQPSSALTRRSM